MVDDEFIVRVLEGMGFGTFVAERGTPYRSCDIFDEVSASFKSNWSLGCFIPSFLWYIGIHILYIVKWSWLFLGGIDVLYLYRPPTSINPPPITFKSCNSRLVCYETIKVATKLLCMSFMKNLLPVNTDLNNPISK